MTDTTQRRPVAVLEGPETRMRPGAVLAPGPRKG
jgi:hypothetical protein